MSSGLLRHTLFHGLIWHLVLFGSARVSLLTVKICSLFLEGQ